MADPSSPRPHFLLYFHKIVRLTAQFLRLVLVLSHYRNFVPPNEPLIVSNFKRLMTHSCHFEELPGLETLRMTWRLFETFGTLTQTVR